MTEMTYRHFPWQESVWQRLQQARHQERLPHAILLAGPEGVGKNGFAFAFAQSLLCGKPDEKGEPCGVCRHCHLLQAGNHPDFQLIKPEEESKSGEIKVRMIRDLTSGTSLTARSGGYKVVIVRPAERMNSAAANSLLKTLEEPASNTLLILVSDHPSRLLPTIRSRCQRFTFPHPDAEQAIHWLVDKIGTENAESLLDLAGGAPLKALQLQADESLTRRPERFREFLRIAQERVDPVKIVAEWSKQDLRQLMEWLTTWIIDMLRLQACDEPPLLYNRREKQALQQLAEQLNSAVLQQFLLQVYEVRALLESNLNPQLMLEKLLIDWHACLHQAGH